MEPHLAWALGGQEMILVFLVILLLFGAKKLPELARGLGKSAGEFKRAKKDFDDELNRAADEAEREWDVVVFSLKEAPSNVVAAESDDSEEKGA